jgi:L-seryl-tRNA(Ser) seleniumtransferase
MRIDKLSLAGLVATLRLYRPPHDPLERIPVLRMLAEDDKVIARRSARLARKLNALTGVQATVVDGVGYAGGGALPMQELKSRLIRLEVSGLSPRQLSEKLRSIRIPIIARIADDAVHLDLRTVLPQQLRSLAEQVREAIA